MSQWLYLKTDRPIKVWCRISSSSYILAKTDPRSSRMVSLPQLYFLLINLYTKAYFVNETSSDRHRENTGSLQIRKSFQSKHSMIFWVVSHHHSQFKLYFEYK